VNASKIDLKPGIYIGAAVSGALLLLPFIKLLFAPACLLGPLIAVWFTLRRRADRLTFADGAQLGFYSAFYGSLTAVAVDRILVRFFHEQLWRFENIYRLPPLLAGKGLDTDSPSAWYFLLGEIVIFAIFAGAIGAPSGILGVKLFQRSP
jgi:hypothetical protein